MSNRDSEIIKNCLDAAVQGPFFPDWEFSTLMGFGRDEIRAIAESWPDTESPEDQDDAVNNVLNMLLGYPHQKWSVWEQFSTAEPREIAEVLARWRDEPSLDPAAKGTFDRLR